VELNLLLTYLCDTTTGWSKMKQNTCGLDGSVHVFTHVDSERRTCWGRLTDWNKRRCGSEAKLRLKLYGRCTVKDRMTTNSAAVTSAGYVEQGQISLSATQSQSRTGDGLQSFVNYCTVLSAVSYFCRYSETFSLPVTAAVSLRTRFVFTA